MFVPSTAVLENTYARFRFSSTANLTYTGLANDGEVEDYQVTTQAAEPMDYGDAPDSYRTLAASNGARHGSTGPDVRLGILRDLENDGQPSVNADGNDTHPVGALNDEDGVVFNTPLIPGQVATITITVNMTGGFLQGWIDFNGDGDFTDAGEQIISSISPAALSSPFNFNVPAGATLGTTYARFRYSTMPSIASFGPAPNGEVEDYKLQIVEPEDYGDAPDPTYPTLLASNGARHHVDGITFLGNQVDTEMDGLPNATATGDDLNNLADEDGVTFLWPVAACNPCKIKVKASVGDAYLNAWIDFNRNGSWGDAGEQVFTDKNLVAGDNYLTFIAPANVVPGSTFARFRFSHQPGLSYTGYAFDGEVEDYAVTISQLGNIKWQQSYETTLPGLHSDQSGWVADDWICGGGQVTDIHWWGNYEMDATHQEEWGQGINYFLIKIYSNAACLPGAVIQTYTVPYSSVSEVNTGSINSEMCPIYYYEYTLSQPFVQTQGVVYWISIQAISNNPVVPYNAEWRWQEANSWYNSISCGAASYAPGSTWMTLAWSDGKFSDMAFAITSQALLFDYGDAPDPTYPTLLASNGARHKNTGLKLGNLIDVEADGQPNATATGDDNNPAGANDEDGIWWSCNLIPGQASTIKVTTNGSGFLNAWIDYNKDGDWADPGEQVFTAKF